MRFAAARSSLASLSGETLTSSTTGSRDTMMIGCMSPIGSNVSLLTAA